MKMYLLLQMVIVHGHVSFGEGNGIFFENLDEKKQPTKKQGKKKEFRQKIFQVTNLPPKKVDRPEVLW